MARKQRFVQVLSAVLLLVLIAATCGVALGSDKAGARTARTASAPRAQATAASPTSGARFSLEFVGADLVDVFQALATQSGVNIATSGSVTGKSTLRLRNVTLSQAMNIVTKLNGLDYAWVDAAYVVGTPEEVRSMKVSELRTSVVVLQHIQPEYAQEVLSKMAPDVTCSVRKGQRSVLLLAPEAALARAERVLSDVDVAPIPTAPSSGVLPARYVKADQLSQAILAAVPDCSVQPGPQENSLLVTANDRQWETIRSIAQNVDMAPGTAQATQAIYHVRYTDPTELQQTLAKLLPDLQVILAPRSFTPVVQKPKGASETLDLLAAPQFGGAGGGGGGATATKGVTMEAAPVTALILTGAPWTVEQGLKVLDEIDRAPRQIHIAAMVTEVNRSDITQLGIDWSSLGTAGADFTIGEPYPEGEPEAARPLPVGRIMRTSIQWMGVIHALQSQGRARILSNPSVTTLDGRQTTLHAGDKILYPVVISASTTGGVITDTRELDTGVTLSVNPRISADGEITLTLSPSIAALSTISIGGLPSINERAVVTTVRVHNGETAVLAGLISDEERVTVTKVPFLGNVPILGELFKFRNRSPIHTEIMIFVTPTIIEN
jgi:general secretion pathway protein D